MLAMEGKAAEAELEGPRILSRLTEQLCLHVPRVSRSIEGQKAG